MIHTTRIIGIAHVSIYKVVQLKNKKTKKNPKKKN